MLSFCRHGKIFIRADALLKGGKAYAGILYLVCKFLVVLSGAVLGILSGIIFLAALVLFFVAGFLPGLAWLMIAFLISPYGLPLAAAWLVGIIGGANSALKDFIFG